MVIDFHFVRRRVVYRSGCRGARPPAALCVARLVVAAWPVPGTTVWHLGLSVGMDSFFSLSPPKKTKYMGVGLLLWMRRPSNLKVRDLALSRICHGGNRRSSHGQGLSPRLLDLTEERSPFSSYCRLHCFCLFSVRFFTFLLPNKNSAITKKHTMAPATPRRQAEGEGESGSLKDTHAKKLLSSKRRRHHAFEV